MAISRISYHAEAEQIGHVRRSQHASGGLETVSVCPLSKRLRKKTKKKTRVYARRQKKVTYPVYTCVYTCQVYDNIREKRKIRNEIKHDRQVIYIDIYIYFFDSEREKGAKATEKSRKNVILKKTNKNTTNNARLRKSVREKRREKASGSRENG